MNKKEHSKQKITSTNIYRVSLFVHTRNIICKFVVIADIPESKSSISWNLGIHLIWRDKFTNRTAVDICKWRQKLDKELKCNQENYGLFVLY